jgi:hypothetical protein
LAQLAHMQLSARELLSAVTSALPIA